MPTSSTIERVAVIGSGSWGGTLAWLLARAGRHVSILTRDADKMSRINDHHRIDSPKQIDLPESVRAYSNFEEIVDIADCLLLCCPSQAMRSVVTQLASAGSAVSARTGNSFSTKILINTAKGLELSSYKRMSEVIKELLPENPVCTLSGPNLADEILAGLPSASVIACESMETAEVVQVFMNIPGFRVYCNVDINGVELGGTLKNVLAIAAGASDGLNLGYNAKAALLTRGLAEMTRFAIKLGAKPQTLAGLSGMGDLVATCFGPTSRNYRLGMELAKGRSARQVLDELGVAVEGVPTTKAICELSSKMGIELPIAQQVELVLEGKTTTKEAIMSLMNRRLASEY